MKKDCDNCKHFNKRHFEKHTGLPCGSKKMKNKFKGYNFWVFYSWAKNMELFSCKGFDELSSTT